MRIGIFVMKALEIAFFVGLIGCTSTVLISWVVILKDSFSKDDEKSASGPA